MVISNDGGLARPDSLNEKCMQVFGFWKGGGGEGDWALNSVE